MMEIYLPTKLFKHLFLVFSFLLFALLANAQKTWSGAAGAAWNVAGNWTPAGIPGAADAVTINAGATPVVTAAAVCASIQINNSIANATTRLTINAGQTITVGGGTGAVNIGNGGTGMGNGSASTTSILVNGTLISGNINQSPSIRLNGAGGAGSDNLTISATGTVTVTGNVTGTSVPNPGPLATASVIFTGGGTLNVTGTFTTSVFTPSTGIVNYNGTALQSINPLYTTYGTLKSNNPAGVTLGAGVTVTNLVVGDIVASSILNDNGKQIIGNAAGTFNLNSGTFNIGIPATATSFPTLFTTGNIIIAAGTTVNYNSAQPQIIRAVNYGNLINTNNGNRTLEIAGTIGIRGTFTPGGGTYTVGTSTVSFNGTAAQVIPALTFSFNNLIINNNAGISSIGSDITVSNSLALTNGVVTTGANKIIIPSGASVSRTNGWVNGNLQQFIPSGALSNFYVGSSTVYRPVVINFSDRKSVV